MIVTYLAQHTTTVLAGTGLLDTANEKAAAVQVTLRAVAAVGSIFFVIKNAISSGGAIARIAISAVAAGAFMWIVFNVTDLQNRVGNEVKPAAAPVIRLAAAAPDLSRPVTVTFPGSAAT